MTLAPGTVLAGYTIERVLGSGGMGTVYLARHRTLPRSDALKVLSAELSRDQEFRARFIREADLAATLNHPNIVTVHDRGETDEGQLWIAMQFVDGTDANAEIQSGGMPPERALHIITEVAKALDYAHGRNLLHRDIKPANFLLSGPPGDQERVFLADFGIARALDDATGLTATGSLVATASYASPEAIEGQRVDARADLYSLGCSLFRLLTGRTPYGHLTGMSAVMMAHVLQPVPRLTELAPWLPPAIDEVIATSMAKDPAARYQSGRALAEAAAAALRGQPLPMLPPPGLPPVAAPPAPPPAHAESRSAITYPSGHFTAPVPAAPVKPRRRGWMIAALVAVVTLIAGTTTALLMRGGDKEPPYQPQSFDGAFGTVQVNQRPHAVAALGPGDADAVLSLHVQPVVMTAPGGQLPPWEKDLANSNPAVLPAVDPAAIAAAKPDFIIHSGELDQATYAKLSSIAPTITRPKDAGGSWNWQSQLTWVGKILGRDDAAKSLIADAANQLTQVRMQHGNFAGKSITVINYSGNESSVPQRQSAATGYLESLGFTYNPKFERADGAPTDQMINPRTEYNAFATDVVIVCRTDPSAGSGGFGGLPSAFTRFNGVLVIVDNPATINALNTGGPAATNYLNTSLVDTLAEQIH